MPETYNPQERTFIKKPENKICVACGQPIHAQVTPMTNEMSHYVHPTTGNKIVLNSTKDIMEIQGIKMERVDPETGLSIFAATKEVAKTITPPATTTNPPTSPTKPKA